MSSQRVADSIRKSLAMGPSVRNLLSRYQLDPAQITSTGPHKTLLKSDVLSFVNQKNLASKIVATTSSQRLSKVSSGAAPTQSNHKTTTLEVSDLSMVKSKYARKSPTQYEIDMINSGGLIS